MRWRSLLAVGTVLLPFTLLVIMLTPLAFPSVWMARQLERWMSEGMATMVAVYGSCFVISALGARFLVTRLRPRGARPEAR